MREKLCAHSVLYKGNGTWTQAYCIPTHYYTMLFITRKLIIKDQKHFKKILRYKVSHGLVTNMRNLLYFLRCCLGPLVLHVSLIINCIVNHFVLG